LLQNPKLVTVPSVRPPRCPGPLGAALAAGRLASKQRAKRASTYRSYEGHVRNYIRPVIGDLPLERINLSHIEAVLQKVTGSAGTRHRVLATLRAEMNSAVKQRLLQYRACTGIEMEPENPDEAQRFTPAQARQFIEKTADDPMGLMFRVAVLKGVRRGELVGLRWDGWDPVERSFTLGSTLLQLGGKLTAGTPKTKAGIRKIFLPPQTARLIEQHREAQAFQAQIDGIAPPELVFCQPNGEPWNPDHVTKRFPKLCAQAGVPSMKLHEGGRHTGRSLMGDADVPEDVSMREVGHSDRKTHGRYNHPLVIAHQQAAEDVENLVMESGEQS
jgi:integrase